MAEQVVIFRNPCAEAPAPQLPVEITIKSDGDFVELLRKHDWQFSRSDDHKTWESGVKEHDALKAYARSSAFRRFLFSICCEYGETVT